VSEPVATSDKLDEFKSLYVRTFGNSSKYPINYEPIIKKTFFAKTADIIKKILVMRIFFLVLIRTIDHNSCYLC
jgi:hypothetical protein